MKKTKFLSCAVMAAFMALGLSSCEKENFVVEAPEVDVDVPQITIPGINIPEGYKPGDALISIQPSVLALINGEAKTVTDETTFTFNGEKEFTYTVKEDGSIDKMDVKVVATYVANVKGFEKTLTAETTVKIPNLAAGQVAIMYPTLMVSVDGEVDFTYDSSTTPGTVVKEAKEIKNMTDYCYERLDGEVSVKVGYKLIDSKIEDAYKENETVKSIIDSYDNTWEERHPITVEHLYAQTMARVPYTVTVETIEGEIYEKIDWSRSENQKLAATFKAEYRSGVIFDLPNTEYNLNLDGNGHGHGHGHGHGDGDSSNAGGGIIWGE